MRLRPSCIATIRAVKLVIQIPCLNEERTLGVTLTELPRELPGFDVVEWLVIDDGSTDGTIEVARESGVDHVIRLTNNRGLAAAFQAGLDASLKLGADVIVNTDADNQYRAADIPKLIAPILAGQADLVVGVREIDSIEHFSRTKKILQHLGSWVVRRASRTGVSDTTSGFRAYNREAALQLVVVSSYTYTLESLVQTRSTLVAVAQVPIQTNPQLRASRLFGSTATYVRRNALALLRAYAYYEPLRFFSRLAAVFILGAVAMWSPFLADLVRTGDTSGHLQSLLVGAVLFVVAVQLLALGIVGDILAGQRVTGQRIYERVRRLELAAGVQPTHYEPGSEDALRGHLAEHERRLLG